MFNMSDSSLKFESTEKSSTFLFKNNSLDSVALNQLDILPKQNRVGKLTFLLSALNLKVSFPTIISIII